MKHQNGTPEVHETVLSSEGVHPLPTQFRRISFAKLAAGRPTTVELIVAV